MSATDAVVYHSFPIIPRLVWAVLLSIAVLYALVVLVPFYATGLHLMSTGEIYKYNNCIACYNPYEAIPLISSSYALPTLLFVAMIYVELPLLTFVLVKVISRWRNLPRRQRLVWITVVLSALFPFFLTLLSWNQLGAWLWD